MDGDRPGKPPKPPLKAPKVDKQLGRLALSWGGRTPRGRASSIPSHVHARTTYARAHTDPHAQVHNARTHIRTQPYTHACTYTTHAHTYAHPHTRMYAHARAHAHPRTRTCTCSSEGQRPSHSSHWGRSLDCVALA